VFAYMPLEHAESRVLQCHCVHLFERLAAQQPPDRRAAFEHFADYARRHREVIERFGRFPHRNKVLKRESTPEEIAYLNVQGIYEGAGRTFVLVSESTGGNGCPAMFAIVEMQGDAITVSDQFGNCSDIVKAEAKDDSLVVTMPKFDGTGEETTTFRNGHLAMTEKINSEDGDGPERAPGGNLALFVSNKHVAEAMGMKAFVNALKKIMPHGDFQEAREMALSGPGVDFQMHDGVASANACERHNCGDHSFSVVVDQTGQAWGALYNEGKARFFGDPDAAKKRFLDPSFQPR